ncbi:MAG: prepilin peptidase [Alphaproteobacteria bacterium]|jgi:prepilin peptidase CpaA|nr:prepilin peptidase [Alphaproteobacteria bacterium]
MLLTVLSLVFPVVMILAMVADFRTFEIPNRLPLVLALGYPLAAFTAGFSWQQILWAFALGGLMLLVAIVLFALRIMGGGDGKLLAAAVPWTGQEQILEFLLLTTLAGGALAMALLLYRRLPLASHLAGIAALRQLHAKKRDIPYAIAIGGAALIIYPQLPILNG